MNPSALSAQHLLADPAFPQLKVYLIQSTGLAYYADKDADLAAPVSRRLSALGLTDCTSYLSLLLQDAAGAPELDTLIEDLTIGETFFFRHREMFEALHDVVLPDLIARNRDLRHLRIWSAGCSVGAEPYSLAILLRRNFAAHLAGWEVSILGTDINREFLARAHDARFEEWALRSTPEELRRDCFVRSGKSWVLAPEYRQGVSFQYHNLVTHPFPSLLNDLCDFDLILCRNVTIYFSTDIVHRIIDRFHQCLVAGGWLGVGHAEPNLELFRAFRTVNMPGAVLYQKSSDQAPPVAQASRLWQPPTSPVVAAVVARSPDRATAPTEGLPAAGGLGDDLRPGQVAWSGDHATTPVPQTERMSATEVPSDLDTIRALANRGAWVEAARCCEEALARENLTAAIHFYHGLILEQLGQHAEADRALRRVLYLDRNHILAHYYLGLLLQRQDRRPQAARSFRNVLQLLTRIAPPTLFVEGDGISAAELTKLTQMHLEVLEKT